MDITQDQGSVCVGEKLRGKYTYSVGTDIWMITEIFRELGF